MDILPAQVASHGAQACGEREPRTLSHHQQMEVLHSAATPSTSTEARYEQQTCESKGASPASSLRGAGAL